MYSTLCALFGAFLGLSVSGSLLAKEETPSDSAGTSCSPSSSEMLPTRPPFSPKKMLERVQAYLNSFSTFYARFRQEDPDGTIRFGHIYLSRPGKMRLDYSSPTHLLVVSDGAWISYDDKDLDQVSYVPLSATPASFILTDKVDFKTVLVEKVEFSPEHDILITLLNKSDPEIGTLILSLKDDPLRLTGWQIIDQTTQTTLVALMDLETGIIPPPDSFELSNPPRS